MKYVDGFLLAVPKRKIDAYCKMSKKAGKVWREHGALEYRECVAEDLKPGKSVTWARCVKLKPGETVFFSWIVYKSRAHRDRVLAKVMKDPRITGTSMQSMPFDMKRMLYGGFQIVVES
ncbi:MAG TPA: DUF1428 domain-containing protein [Candidatus Eisenbacteria bacterium]|nr:DUF1428 domain-containing protein [Candidatus Eisenbacteria bacterium]